MYEFSYDFIKSKYQDKPKKCYMDTESFIIHIKTEYCYEDIANDVEIWFDTSNYDEWTPLKMIKDHFQYVRT